MSLQSRLLLFFIAIVVLPLAAASVILQIIFVRELEGRTKPQLELAQRAASVVFETRLSALNDRVDQLASDPAFLRLLLERRYEELGGWLELRIDADAGGRNEIDYLVVADSEGRTLASALSKAEFLPGVEPPTVEEIASMGEPTDRRLLVMRVPVPIQAANPPIHIANLYGGYYLDRTLAEELGRAAGFDATILLGGRPIASSLPDDADAGETALALNREKAFQKGTVAGEDVYAVAGRLVTSIPARRLGLVVSTSQEPVLELKKTTRNSVYLLLGLAVAGSALLGFLLARVVARPLRELAAGANAIAAGNYDQHIAARSHDEVGQLARAFNEMAERLSVQVAELRESREELKRALTRFGQTLRATHDERTLLNVVLETSIDTLRAQRGLLMLMTPSRDALSVTVARGVDALDLEVPVGSGIAGTVTATGTPVRLPDGEGGPTRHPEEPEFRTLLAVPIFSQERVIAVLVVYDKEHDLDFTEADLSTMLSLADQAGVAIENVLLHREAQRLSITDGLTGLWNYRYFKMQFEQEIDRAARFKRPFSLVVCDIDDFKVVNDTYGHQRGDAVLVEMARRVKGVIRDIDVLARYGGEEFVLILPETDLDGGVRTAEKIRQVVAERPFGDADPVPVTISAGVAGFPVHGGDGAALFQASDMALLEAKSRGKNRVVSCRMAGPGTAAAG